MKRLISKFFFLLFFSIILTSSCNGQGSSEGKSSSLYIDKEFQFDNYYVKTGFTDSSSIIEIYHNNILIYKNYNGEGVYLEIDTININDDKKPDFILAYAFDSYFTLEVLISNDNGYKSKSLGEYFDPTIYCTFVQNYAKSVRCFVLKDVNHNSKFDILVNVISYRDSLITIDNCTDTIYYSKILSAIKY